MKINLTENQLIEIKDRLGDIIMKESRLRIEQDSGGDVNGWDFAALSNEEFELKEILENKYIEI